MVIFEFITHYKVTFFTARASPNFSPFPLPSKTCASLQFHVREGPKKCFLLSASRRELYGPGPQFFIIW